MLTWKYRLNTYLRQLMIHSLGDTWQLSYALLQLIMWCDVIWSQVNHTLYLSLVGSALNKCIFYKENQIKFINKTVAVSMN